MSLTDKAAEYAEVAMRSWPVVWESVCFYGYYALLLLAVLVVYSLCLDAFRAFARWRQDRVPLLKRGDKSLVADPEPSAAYTHDFLIVGGGVAGATLATSLAALGWKVLVVEADEDLESPPDRIVGELLQPGGVNILRRLPGLRKLFDKPESKSNKPHDHMAFFTKFDGCQVVGYGITNPDRSMTEEYALTYPQDTDNGESNKGVGFHNDRFVKALRDAARNKNAHNDPPADGTSTTGYSPGSVEFRQGRVRSLLVREEDQGGNYIEGVGRVSGVSYDVTAGPESKQSDAFGRTARANLVVVANGCLSLLRSAVHQTKRPLIKSRFLGLVIERDTPLRSVNPDEACKFKDQGDQVTSAETHGKFSREYLHSRLVEDQVLPYEYRGHVLCIQPTPTLAYPISSTETRILVDFSTSVPSTVEKVAEHLMDHVYPQIPYIMRDSFKRAVEKHVQQNRPFQSMPNQSLHAEAAYVPGVAIMGDILNMRHPFTGAGMSCAFSDIELFVRRVGYKHQCAKAKPVASDGTVAKVPGMWTADLKKHYVERTKALRVTNMLADALYDVFCDGDLRDPCYSYLKEGGWYAEGPVRLLAILSRSQPLLMFHYLHVAAYAIWQTLKYVPTPGKLWRCCRMVQSAINIICPLFILNNNNIAVRAVCHALSWIFWTSDLTGVRKRRPPTTWRIKNNKSKSDSIPQISKGKAVAVNAS